jgi:drug/metabolite transporter (DMT)-like permease
MTDSDDRSTPESTSPAPAEQRHASLLQVAGAVFWSFFGVRKGRHMQQDMTIKPLHVVVVGLLSGLAFVLVLLALVTFITRNAP